MNSQNEVNFKIEGKHYKTFVRRITEEGFYVIAVKDYWVKVGSDELRGDSEVLFNSIHKEDIVDLTKEECESRRYENMFFTFISLSDEEYISLGSGWNIKPAKREK